MSFGSCVFNEYKDEVFNPEESNDRNEKREYIFDEDFAVKKKENKVTREFTLTPGNYGFEIQRVEIKLLVSVDFVNLIDEKNMKNVSKELQKGSSFFEVLVVEEKEAIVRLSFSIRGKKQKVKIGFYRIVPKKKEFEVRLYANEEVRSMSIHSDQTYEELKKQLVEEFGENNVLKYIDPYAEPSIIDDQISLDIFFEENEKEEEEQNLPALFFTPPGIEINKKMLE